MTDATAVRSFVRANTVGYWTSVADAVEQALSDPDRDEFSAEMTSWCVLGLARMLFTAQTGSVSSKTRAGLWLTDQRPDLAPLVNHAVTVRREGPSGPDSRVMATATGHYMRTVIDLVAAETDD